MLTAVERAVWQRTHRHWSDGSSWMGPWTRADQDAEVAR